MIGNFLGGIMLDSGGVSFMLATGLGVSLVGLVLVLLLTERPRAVIRSVSASQLMSEI